MCCAIRFNGEIMIKDYQNWAKKRTSQDKGLYVIMWISLITGYVGHGSPSSKDNAKSAAKFSNELCPDLHHWAVPAE